MLAETESTMGEAKRKAVARIADALENAHAEGQGVWSLDVYHCSVIPEIIAGSAMGDQKACELAEVVKAVIALVHKPALGVDKPTLCMTCDTAFTPASKPPEAFVIVSPGARNRMISLLCEPCHRHPDMKARVLEKVRWGMIPDAREIQIGEPGRA